MKTRTYREERWIGDLSARFSPTDSGYSVTTVTMYPMVKNKTKRTEMTFNLRHSACKSLDRKIGVTLQSDHGIVRWSSRFAGPSRTRWAPQKKKKRDEQFITGNVERGFPRSGNGPREDEQPLHVDYDFPFDCTGRNSTERSFSGRNDGTSRRIWVSNRHNLFWI